MPDSLIYGNITNPGIEKGVLRNDYKSQTSYCVNDYTIHFEYKGTSIIDIPLWGNFQC